MVKHFASQSRLRRPRFSSGCSGQALCFAKPPTASPFLFGVHYCPSQCRKPSLWRTDKDKRALKPCPPIGYLTGLFARQKDGLFSFSDCIFNGNPPSAMRLIYRCKLLTLPFFFFFPNLFPFPVSGTLCMTANIPFFAALAAKL